MQGVRAELMSLNRHFIKHGQSHAVAGFNSHKKNYRLYSQLAVYVGPILDSPSSETADWDLIHPEYIWFGKLKKVGSKLLMITFPYCSAMNLYYCCHLLQQSTNKIQEYTNRRSICYRSHVIYIQSACLYKLYVYYCTVKIVLCLLILKCTLKLVQLQHL